MNSLDANTVRRLAEATQADIEELVRLRAWDKDGDGYQIHDYSVYNPDQEELHEKRSEAGRKGALARWGENGKIGFAISLPLDLPSEIEPETLGKTKSVDSKSIASAIANPKQTDGTGTPVPVTPKGLKSKTLGASRPKETPEFAAFWCAYPPRRGRKNAKDEALKWWNREKPDAAQTAMIMTALEVQKQTSEWLDGFVPDAIVWLRNKRWEDEITESVRTPPKPNYVQIPEGWEART